MYFQWNGHQYDITVNVPEAPYPKEGLPVLYVLDGAHNGVLVNEMVRMQMHMRKQTKIARMIVVTIQQPSHQRFADFTPYATHYEVSQQFPMPQEGDFGKSHIFAAFLEEVLKPYIAEHYPSGARHILLGHSLSAYFVLWQMVQAPSRFTGYIAISPSVWWNNESLLQSDFTTLTDESPHALYIAVGEYERSMHAPIDRLIARLPAQMTYQYDIAPEENHLSVFPTVLSRALRYVQAHK